MCVRTRSALGHISSIEMASNAGTGNFPSVDHTLIIPSYLYTEQRKNTKRAGGVLQAMTKAAAIPPLCSYANQAHGLQMARLVG